jgi:hypothetical protein
MAKEKHEFPKVTRKESFGRWLQAIGIVALATLAALHSAALALTTFTIAIVGGQLIKSSGEYDRAYPGRDKPFRKKVATADAH